MKFNWIHRASDLEEKGIPFAIATVIDTVAPTSAKPMAKAIKTADGKMVSKPLEDMFPFLDRKEFYDNMYVKPIEEK